MRNYVDTLHRYGLINELNLPTYVSPSTGIDTSSIGHLRHNLKCSRLSYIVTPAISDSLCYMRNFSQSIMIALQS